MKATADATVSRDALHAAVRRVLPKSRKAVVASVTLAAGEAGTPTIASAFGVAVPVAIEGEWAAEVDVHAAVLLAMLKAGLPPLLRLTWHGGVLMVGPTSLPAFGRYMDPGANAAADGSKLTPPPGPGEEPPKRRGRRPKPPPVRYSNLMPDEWG